MRGIRHGGAIGVSAVCAWCAVSAIPVAADGAAPAQALAESSVAVRAYWTGARMRGAKPADALAPSPLEGSADRPVAAQGAKRTGLHQRVRKTSSYPNRTDGAVFFTLPGGPPDGGDYECSGTAVRSAGRSLVWTAGHCVFDPGALGAG